MHDGREGVDPYRPASIHPIPEADRVEHFGALRMTGRRWFGGPLGRSPLPVSTQSSAFRRILLASDLISLNIAQMNSTGMIATTTGQPTIFR
jgi:hypothetical protein